MSQYNEKSNLNNNDKIIEIKDLTYLQQGQKILNIPQFCLEAEESTSLMGPNGAGKSSLLLVMAGLLQPTDGNIILFGKNMNDHPPLELQRRMAMVFQKPILPDLTVLENLELGLRFRQMKQTDREKKIVPWLEKMRLTHLVKRRTRSLSGGEAQRVAIAQALIVEPELIFLDEPFANLDKDKRQESMVELRKLLKNQKIATVMVTHSRTEALAMSDSIYHLEDGEIIHKEILHWEIPV